VGIAHADNLLRFRYHVCSVDYTQKVERLYIDHRELLVLEFSEHTSAAEDLVQDAFLFALTHKQDVIAIDLTWFRKLVKGIMLGNVVVRYTSAVKLYPRLNLQNTYNNVSQ